MDTVRTYHPRPRLLIADDHAIFSDALQSYLEKYFDIETSPGRSRPAQ